LSRLYILILMTASSFVFAQSADLELEAHFESSNDVTFGFVGNFSVTLTNNGPDDIEGSFIISPLVNSSGYSFTPDDSNPQPNCFPYFVAVEPRPPLNLGGTLLVFESSNIAAGVSITCYGMYAVNFQSGSRSFTWETYGFEQGVLVDDPVPENNFVTITLGIQPQQVSTLSNVSILIMLLLAWVVGIKHEFLNKVL